LLWTVNCRLSTLFVLSFGEDLGSERLNPCFVAPSIGGQTGLETGLFKELLAVPVPLSGNLRQQEATVEATRDEQPVATHFNFFGTDVGESGEN
jgi:hypothetical protein